MFGTIHTFASNNCLCHGNVFQNGVSAFSKKVNHILPKTQNIVHFVSYDFVQFSPACDHNAYQIICGKILDFHSQDP